MQFFRNSITVLCWALLACGLFVFAGCGSGGMSKVHGKVTYSDGSPVPNGTVEMDGPSGTASGEIQSDGSYEMGMTEVKGGMPDGSYKVKVSAYGEGTGGPGPPLVAEKYLSYESSGLTLTVEGADKEFNIKVEKP